ncbi:enoyl-CoA hydratase [Chryseobacterium arthrosphaerae]|uniref:enoyl-CoA hydratase n=1 Tax=Chryseobacterium arthrosphaerae TaxID=651561 RepID=UPI001E556C1A|nr:enoyl-CoA hydratase [Chryseobacterium arthrosphaerae]UEQ76951.1 enoyl-CoA hydratase [Chryseobacterium arthrosphaerae]
MTTKEDVFNLIKKNINLSGGIDDYHIKLSDGRFYRENMIGVYSIREEMAINKKNHKLAKQLHQLLIGLRNNSGILLKGVIIKGRNYSGMFYLSENYDKVIGYLEDDIDESDNIIS